MFNIIKINIGKLKLWIILLACILKVGCAGIAPKEFIALPDTAKQQISSSKFVFIHSQDELNATVIASNISQATGGGLLVALADTAITNNRAKEAEKLLAPIRSELIDFDMDKEITQALLPVLKSTAWLHAKNISDIKIMHGNSTEIINKLSNDATNNKDVVGVISSSYVLNAGFTTLEVVVALELYPLNINLKKLTAHSANNNSQNQLQPIYKTKVICNKHLETATKNFKENAKLWSLNNGYAIKHAIKDAITTITLQLKEKLQDPEKEIQE